MNSAIRLTNRALIAVEGEDWRSFLQGLLTQDVSSLAADELRFGAFLTPQGQVRYDLFILGRVNGCWLDVQASQRDEVLKTLTMYRLRAKVTLSTIAAPVWADLIVENAHTNGWAKDPRSPWMGWRGYDVDADASDLTMVDYDQHQMAHGVTGPADWDGKATYPIEANFDLLHGIDFKKGCFIGQETTSRMKRRGQIRSRMMPIVSEEGRPLAPGAEVLVGELRAGEIRSSHGPAAMALLRLDRARGAALTVDGHPVRIEFGEWFAYFDTVPEAHA